MDKIRDKLHRIDASPNNMSGQKCLKSICDQACNHIHEKIERITSDIKIKSNTDGSDLQTKIKSMINDTDLFIK